MTSPEPVWIRYNRLLDIEGAQKIFHAELASAFPETPFDPDEALKKLLSELAPVLSGANGQQYAVWLLHHHYELKEGELMVTHRRVEKDGKIVEIMEPMDENFPHIYPDRWANRWDGLGDKLGDALEHRQLAEGDTPLPPPSAEIWSRFSAIMKNRKITMLGMSLPLGEGELAKLELGNVFLETTNDDDRSHSVKIVPGDERPEFVVASAWIPRIFPSNGDSLTKAKVAGVRPFALTGCSHVCTVTSHRVDQLPPPLRT